MFKKINNQRFSKDKIEEKIKERDTVLEIIEKVLGINIDNEIKLNYIEKGIIKIETKNQYIAQEIILRKGEIIEKIKNNYSNDIKDLKIKVN
jgi:hypothetical protein